LFGWTRGAGHNASPRSDVELGEFRAFVGANGSGKTTLLDVRVLQGDLLRERTISAGFTEQREGRPPRATALRELIFQGLAETFILALEAALPARVTRDLLDTLSSRTGARTVATFSTIASPSKSGSFAIDIPATTAVVRTY
jgi:ATPase subunit of ABC transporter with duplicated ATPase domains